MSEEVREQFARYVKNTGAIEAAVGKLYEAREALEVYADYSNWYFSEHEQADVFQHSSHKENGQAIAVNALAKLEADNKTTE